MSRIMIKCRQTGQLVCTGMATDRVAWNKVIGWAGTPFNCPACNTIHSWVKSDAVLDVSRPTSAEARP
jgi:hypothetical protein